MSLPVLLARPTGSPADWPEFHAITPLISDEPLPAEQWPALALSWQMVTPHVPDRFRGDLVDAWLTQPGAPGPVAVAYLHRFSRSHPYGWRCGVHVIGAPVAGATYEGKRMSYDCLGWGIERTPEAARDGALRHITEQHQDAAVPYIGRLLRAQRFYA